MSWDLLKRFLESDVFNSNPFLSVSYLSRYADHVGIHYVLCNKLRQFPYEDIEFFLPQLCHLIISVDNESMALEEFLLDLCEESVTAALLTFWLFQTYLHDLSSNPSSKAFQTCRRVYNKVQHIVFGLPDAARHDKIKENILPVTVLASFVLASVAVPLVPQWAGPLAVAQARKPQPSEDLISDSRDSNPKTAQVTRAHTVTAGNTRSRRTKDGGRMVSAPDLVSPGVASSNLQHRSTDPSPSRPGSSGSKTPIEVKRLPSHLNMKNDDARLSSSSLPLPELRSPRLAITRPATPVSAGFPPRPNDALNRRHSLHFKSGAAGSDLTTLQKTRLLRQHYFRCETQFLTALEGISNRLVIVPKPARLSALRAELALIAQDLPAEVDVPVICPPTLVDGSPAKSRHHRIVRLNPGESTVLNSAEKVPYLLMVEVLRDDFTFDPDTPDNKRLLATLLSDPGHTRRIFDLSDSPRIPIAPKTPETIVDSVFEPVSGDLGSSPLIKPYDDDPFQKPQGKQVTPSQAQRLPSAGTSAMSTVMSEITTPRSSRTSTSRSSSPTGPLRKMTLSSRPNAVVDQPDFSALATHMRTASQMLAQLEATSGKRPRHEVQAIRAKIIASMQSLEEQSFDMDEQGPTFDTIIAKASTAQANSVVAATEAQAPEAESESPVEPGPNAGAGLARMENDIKTGGIQSKGDRDDPSAAVFGEAWQAKKERIRKTSPYGWMKNWDLVSVIVKTGADLRQEAFACQLIDVCHKIWVDAKVNVWVKLMRILVTGESSGLIETITNGVSLHSIKRSLTLSMETSPGQKRRFATLRDHFVKAFGAPDSEPFKAGVDAFKRSLAAYSMISYILQLKDRHNGNVLIDSEGHIVHIDFGFMLSNSPGSVGFEAAPFKLTQEYIEVLGGIGSDDYEDYKKLCKQAFQALRRSADNIIDLVAMMGRDSKMPCYSAGVVQATHNLRQRFQLQLSADEAEQFVETDLIGKEDKSAEMKKAISLLEGVRGAWKDSKKGMSPDAAVLLNLARLYEHEFPERAQQCLLQVEALELDQIPEEERPTGIEDEAENRAALRKFLPPQLLNNIGCFYSQSEKHEQASEMFEAALGACMKIGEKDQEIDTDALVTTISFNLGRSYESQSIYDKATEVYEGLLKRHDDYTDARTRLAYIKLRRNPNKEGPDAVAKLYQENPQDLEVRALYGWYMGKVHSRKRPHNINEDHEFRHYKHTLQNYDKHDRYALVGMGNLYLIQAREMRRESDSDKAKRSATYSKAVEFFEKALSLDPKNAYAAQGIAIALVEDKKDYKTALGIFVKIRDTIKDAHVYVNLGHIYAELRQYSKAIENYEVALSKEGKGNDPVILACLGRTWLNKGRSEKLLDAYHEALKYAQKALEAAPEQVHYKFNVAFVQIQMATTVYALNENQRTLVQLQEAATGLESAISALDEIASHPQTPYPKHDVEQRANMARNTQRKQLERAIASQKEYEEKNKEKLQAALEQRQAELRKREEERQKALDKQRERQEKIRREREEIAARDREIAERRAEEEKARQEAEMTTDSETGDKVKRKKKAAPRGDGESRPKRGSRKKKATETDGEDSGEERPTKKKRRLTKKESTVNSKYKSAEIIVDSDDEDEDEDPLERAERALEKASSPLSDAEGKGGDDDDKMEVDNNRDADEEDDEDGGISRRQQSSRSRRGRVIESDEDEDEDEDEAPKKNGAGADSDDEADKTQPAADTSMVDADDDDEE